MIADPNVLILDEPTSGLDPIQIRQTLEAIKGLASTHTVLLSTHILSEVEAICDRVIIISRGTIRWDGRLSRLAEQVPILVMEVRGPAADVKPFLEQQSGVKKVADRPLDDGVTLFEIEQERGRTCGSRWARRCSRRAGRSAGLTCGGRAWRPCTQTWC